MGKGWDDFNDRAAEKPHNPNEHLHRDAFKNLGPHAAPYWYALLAILIAVDHSLNRIARALEAPRKCPGPINTRVTLIDKEVPPVNTTINVDPALNDLLIKTAPVWSDGSPREATLLFATSAPTVVALEIAPDGKSAKGRLLSTGVCTITVNDTFTTDEVQVIAESGPAPTPGAIGTTVELIAKGA